jgi:hypothetical protein
VLGPSNGNTTYGPDGTPQYASVWPKSSLSRARPMLLATSKMPSRPTVELTTKRLSDLPAHGRKLGQVVEEIGDTLVDRPRRYVVIPDRYRLQGMTICKLVEGEDVAVEGLPRILRGAGRCGMQAHRQHAQKYGHEPRHQHCVPPPHLNRPRIKGAIAPPGQGANCS